MSSGTSVPISAITAKLCSISLISSSITLKTLLGISYTPFAYAGTSIVIVELVKSVDEELRNPLYKYKSKFL